MKDKAYWETAIEVLPEIGVKVGDKRMFWEYQDEGIIFMQSWNPDDPNDYPHLRFSCQRHVVGALRKKWEEIPDSSFCTQLPIDIPIKHLIYAAAEVMEVIKDLTFHDNGYPQQSSYKKRLEELSWLEANDFMAWCYHQ